MFLVWYRKYGSIWFKRLKNIRGSVKDIYIINFYFRNKFASDQNLTGQYKPDDIVYFSLCEDVNENKQQCVVDSQKVRGQIFYPGENGCELFAGSIDNGNKWERGANDSIKITFNGGAEYKDEEGKTHLNQVIFEFYCKKGEELTMFDSVFDLRSKNNTIKFYSEHACPQIDFYFIWKFITDKKIIFASGLILVGLFLALFGNYFIGPTIFIVCIAAIILFFFIFFFQLVIPSNTNEAVVWVVLAVGVVVGGVVGYFVTKYKKIALPIVLGVSTGIVLSQLIYITILSYIHINPNVLKYLTMAILIIVLGVLSYFLLNILLILCTAFIGAYAFIRGISLFAGGFPNETTIMNYIEEGEYEALKNLLNWKVYVYFAAIIIAFVLGAIVQFKLGKDKKAVDEDEEMNNSMNRFLSETDGK